MTPAHERCVLHRERRSRCGSAIRFASTRPRAISPRFTTRQALPALLAEAALRDAPLLVLGEGSNVLLRRRTLRRHDRAPCLCAAPHPRRRARTPRSCAPKQACTGTRSSTGRWRAGLCGLENLALIPGHCGAAPIQNIGAYGVEIGESIVTVDAYDRADRANCAACRTQPVQFGYRDSLFKREPDRWIVTAIELRLAPARRAESRATPASPKNSRQWATWHRTADNVAAAVRRIRRRKLPDPAVIGNAGSFLQESDRRRAATAANCRRAIPAFRSFPAPTPATRKLSAAWLIEQAGWRGFRDRRCRRLGPACPGARQSRRGDRRATAGAGRVAWRRPCRRNYGVTLEPEPRIVGARFTP